MNDAATVPAETARGRGWATALVLLLALVMAMRLCMTETLRETLVQKSSRLAAEADPAHHVATPVVGPGATLGFAAALLVIAGAAGVAAARAGALGWARVARWAVVAGIAGLGWVSVCGATNRFAALVGTADVAAVLAAGWAIALLCDGRLAGERGRRIVFAATAAVLTAWVGQGLEQHFFDQPETVAAFEKDHDPLLRSMGIEPGSAGATLYESRIRSGELEGFLTLANVTAAGFVGLLTVAVGLVVVTLLREGGTRRMNGQVPAGVVFACGGVVVVILGAYLLTLTQSNGGAAMGLVCMAAAAVGIPLRRVVGRWRRVLVMLGIVGFLAGMAGVVGYGMVKHRLPGKSLTFRWYYWSGAARMIQERPLAGVGMNNFGSYYVTDKPAAAPEDVSDPHGYFVRLAAELGIPAAVLAGALVLWTAVSAARRRAPERTTERPAPVANVAAIAAAAALAWWLGVYALSWPSDTYYLYLVFIYSGVTAGAATATCVVMQEWAAGGDGADAQPGAVAVAMAGLIGAAGMFVYDQINMALVTGGAALLFWMLLGTADAAAETRGRAAGRGAKAAAAAVGAVTILAGAALAVFAWVPVLRGTLTWDPGPAEYAYLRAAMAGDLHGAEAALDRAIALAPRSVELRMQRFGLRRKLGEPVAQDVREMLAIDRMNAGIRLTLALPDTDVPPVERVADLQEALRLDQQLAADEPKRLTAEQLAQVKEKIEQLQGGRAG